MGFTGLLLIAFIVLKLCNVINWSWWLVLSPAWIKAGLAAVIGIVALLHARFFSTKKQREEMRNIREQWNAPRKSALDERLERLEQWKMKQKAESN